jgi:hypothetical protein
LIQILSVEVDRIAQSRSAPMPWLAGIGHDQHLFGVVLDLLYNVSK